MDNIGNMRNRRPRGGRRNRRARGQRRSGGQMTGALSNKLVQTPQIVRFPPSCFGFPARLIAKVRYSDTVSMTSTTGSVASWAFRTNSTRDPDQTATGHQPMYRDVFAGVYDNYAVISSRILVRFTNTSTTAPFVVSVNSQDGTAAASSLGQIVEENFARSAFLTPLAGARSSASLVVPWSAARNLNIDPFTSEAYKTPVGSDPTDQEYFVVNAATADASTATIYFQVVIEYETLWSELTLRVSD